MLVGSDKRLGATKAELLGDKQKTDKEWHLDRRASCDGKKEGEFWFVGCLYLREY